MFTCVCKEIKVYKVEGHKEIFANEKKNHGCKMRGNRSRQEAA